MIISENWLREWVDFDPAFDSLPAILTGAGLETGIIEEVAPLPESIVAGHVREIAPHPDADSLTICQVDVGDPKTHQVICGASNVSKGVVAPFARIRTRLPSGLKIDKAVIRGQASAGMLCSAAELGLEEQSSGLLLLDPELRPGDALNPHLQLPDRLLEVELTPNRGDCLSILGIAREVAALTGGSLLEPKLPRVRPIGSEPRVVTLDGNGGCARYVGRTITEVRSGARTPDLLRERLRRVGSRSIDALVDITNYVMLEIGQPMHAFDSDRLKGDICVRSAMPRERIKLLDGEQVTLDADALLITDRSGAVALAGIKGGASTMIHARTRAIFLEAACFDPNGIAQTARRHNLNTDASHRFERGVDFQLPAKAIERASALVFRICGGSCGPRVESAAPRLLPKRRWVTLRASRLQRMLGVKVPTAQVSAVFTALGMNCQRIQGGWRVKAPSHRYDIEAEHDLVEEVARVVGYDRFPVNRPKVAASRRLSPEALVPLDRAKDFLVDRGYREAITYSFVSADLQKHVRGRQSVVKLKNPISVHMAEMRVSLLPGLLGALAYNTRRQVRDIRLFEAGHVYLKRGKVIRENQWLGGVVTGSANGTRWDQDSRAVDFFDIKGDVEDLARASQRTQDLSYTTGTHPAYQAGQYADISAKGRTIGRIGRVSSVLLTELDIAGPVFAFELDWKLLQQGQMPTYSATSRYPAVNRDISLVISKDTPAVAVQTCIETSAQTLMVALELIDLYEAPEVGHRKKSLTYRLTLQSNYRNLTDDEVDRLIEVVLEDIREEIGGELRSS